MASVLSLLPTETGLLSVSSAVPLCQNVLATILLPLLLHRYILEHGFALP